MPSFQIYDSKLNPVRLVRLDAPPVAGKNFVHFDEDWYINTILNFETKMPYYQKWQQTDTIRMQFRSTTDLIKVELITCEQRVVKSVTATKVITDIVGQPWELYEASLQLADVPKGLYYVLVTAGFGEFIQQFISEPQDIRLKHENTMLLEYTHFQNEYGTIFAYGFKPSFRCEAIITDYQPGADDTVYVDQIYDTTLLSSKPFRNFKFSLGGPYGVPDWVADKVNRIFSCSNVLADKKQFTRPEGTKMEPNRSELYPLAGWKFDIRESQNDYDLNYDSEFDQKVVVVYNVRTDVFGTLNGPVENNAVQIIETDFNGD